MTKSLHPRTISAINKALALGMDSLRAEVPQCLSDWAAEYFKLAGESSHQKGAWEGWPFQVGMLDFMSDDRIEELYVMKSKRVGYTKMVTAYLCYNIAHRRRKQALWQPTDDDRDSYVKSEIDPVFDQVDAVKKARRQGKGSEDTIKLKQFRDSATHLLGGRAARAFRRITVAASVLDEWDAFEQQVEKSGDPGGLAKGRLEGAPHPKFIGGTTPRVKGLSHVERHCDLAEGLVRFHIDCPRCGLDHPLMWGGKSVLHGFKWERGNPASVRHVCPHCRETIAQADYLRGGKPMGGAWVCSKTGKRYGIDKVWRDSKGMPTRPPRTLGVHVWAAYSPQRSWVSIVEEFESALIALEKGDVGPMQLFVNETLGETWEMQGDRSDEHALQARAESYPLGTVPVGALVLTCGIDLQRNRWELTTYGWGRGLESWVVDVQVIEGNPSSDDDWVQITEYLQRRYRQAWHGGTLGLSAISIDSSDQTQAVYNWVRKSAHILPNLRAVKGSSEDHKPVLGPSSIQDVDWRGQKWPKGVKLWTVGVDTAKDMLLGQLAIDKPGPGFIHFSVDLQTEFYLQLTAEQRVLTRNGGKEAYKWVKRRPRNEQLDTRNYALHAAFGLGLHRYTDKRWEELERAVQPPRDLFAAPAIEVPASPRQVAAAPAPAPAPVVTRPNPLLQRPSRRPTPARSW